MNKKHNIKHFSPGILLLLLLVCPPAFAKKQQMNYVVEKPAKQTLLQTHATDGTYRYEYTLTDHLGSVRAVFTEDGPDADNQPDILASRAYMPGGMLMPGTLDETGVHYRFGYQGQFAEEDDETGYNQFMARLYDPRIGRWLIPDAAGQYWNPYLAMGNNWINGVDPDGEKWYESTSNPGTFEWFTGWQSFKAFMSSDWSMTPRGGTTTNFGSGWTITAEPVTITASIPNKVKSPWGGMMLNPVIFGNYNPGTISQYIPNFFGRIEESTLGQTFVGKAVYGVVDDAYVYSTSLIYNPSGARHLNRSCVVGSELQDAGISTLTNLVPIGKMGSALGISKKTLNAGQFNVLYKGSGITAATGGGVQIRAYNQAIRTHTGFQKAFTWFEIGTTAVGATQK